MSPETHYTAPGVATSGASFFSGVPEWTKGAAFDAVDRRFESDPRYRLSMRTAD